ncbi:hypothetical protein [Spongiivirga citrea]|uniref:Uncharacterized protein n=1 Tax=Spongiivirga citrea TaxID=1481457 RepID=A0A6M0CFR7_9FLAO|nr:hypothetical protein [Spongiivirga citrea]NER16726.1 hypothetical protein [Spongiivirga citrea]
MLGLILIYFIGKRFYTLAEEFNKHKWGFAILGVVSYYIGTFIGGILIGILGMIFMWDFVLEETNNFALGLVALPFGIALCIGLYYLLQYLWKREGVEAEVNIDEIGRNTAE